MDRNECITKNGIAVWNPDTIGERVNRERIYAHTNNYVSIMSVVFATGDYYNHTISSVHCYAAFNITVRYTNVKYRVCSACRLEQKYDSVMYDFLIRVPNKNFILAKTVCGNCVDMVYSMHKKTIIDGPIHMIKDYQPGRAIDAIYFTDNGDYLFERNTIHMVDFDYRKPMMIGALGVNFNDESINKCSFCCILDNYEVNDVIYCCKNCHEYMLIVFIHNHWKKYALVGEACNVIPEIGVIMDIQKNFTKQLLTVD